MSYLNDDHLIAYAVIIYRHNVSIVARTTGALQAFVTSLLDIAAQQTRNNIESFSLLLFRSLDERLLARESFASKNNLLLLEISPVFFIHKY